MEEYSYQYDMAGNKIKACKQRQGMDTDSGSFQYGYDALNRLTEVSRNGSLLRHYAYDAFGNRTVKEDYSGQTAVQITYRYNAGNQMVSRVDEEGEQSYVYDRRGNLTAVSRGEEQLKAFTFDAANRMRSAYEIKDGIGKRAEYTYNAFGNRIGQDIYSVEAGNGIPEAAGQKPQNPEQQIYYTLDLTRQYHNLLISENKAEQKEQTFYWDGNVAAVTTNAAKATITAKAGTAAKAAAEEGMDSYYLQDDLGSPMQLVDEEGEIRETYGFDEFGLDLGNLPERQMQPFGYTGYQMEAAGGLYFAQARRYDAENGRFISEDKISGNIVRPLTLNKYNFCWNNPLVLVDLNGLEPEPITAADGREAHLLLYYYLKYELHLPIRYEESIPHSSINGNTGFADIIYDNGIIVEIYEIKPASYAAFNSINNIRGREQLARYINNYNLYMAEDLNTADAIYGTSLYPVINLTTIPSELHPDRLIKYYMYPEDPGMIYWRYVNLRQEPETVTVPETETVPNTSFDEKDVTDAVITTGEVVVAGVVLYYAAKWIAAGFLAPYTAGGSVVAAACTP